ncbi:MAG: protein phosphatase [Pseudomonadota bacterium]|nr:protein phosphatase [Pseudomonadota bacterium]
MQGWTPNLSWLQPDLAVGGSFPAEKAEVLVAEYEIGAVVDLRSEDCDDAEVLEQCGVWFLHLPTPDMSGASQEMLDEGVNFAGVAALAQRRLLIHCLHGIGRSATLALCVLVDRGLAPAEALLLAKDARALVSPSEAQYRAWASWLARRGKGPIPSYHEFGVVAYRRLPQDG